MFHKPIQIKDLELSFPVKTCFESFNCLISYGNRIAIIGRNGSGKSTLLKMLAKLFVPTTGVIIQGTDVICSYIPQVIEDYAYLSGGQRLNAAITKAISLHPNLLLLDEPTNHLDSHNRKSLIRMLQNYTGTLIIVSHDTELLRNCVDNLWHIDNGKIQIFSGKYNDYMHEMKLKRASIENQLVNIRRKKKDLHTKLMQEQQRVAKSRAKGEKKIENQKWLKMVGNLKGMQAEKSQGKKLKDIDATKNNLSNKLAELRIPEIILPKFSINNSNLNNQMLVQISNGTVAYSLGVPIISNINLSITDVERVAIIGDNGSGKTTLIKAILGESNIYTTGNWYILKSNDIGYLDQHYSTLDVNKSVFETIVELVPQYSTVEIRYLLSDFLFRKNKEVNALVNTLSGGEKARLTLAKIAAKTPKLLILDEITNNLDLETKEHVIQVLKAYPGAMIIISHDDEFLQQIGVNYFWKMKQGTLSLMLNSI